MYVDTEKTWVDDTMERELPELFLIIQPECRRVEEVSVATDTAGCVTVEWDSIPWQDQWVVRLEGPSGTRYDTVDTTLFTYCGLNLNNHYEVSVLSRCFRPGGHNWANWSDAVTIGANAIQPTETTCGHITLSPNPTTGKVTVEAEGVQEAVSVTLHNTSGSEVLRKEGVLLPTTLDTKDLPSGVYLLRIDAPGFFATEKLVVAGK